MAKSLRHPCGRYVRERPTCLRRSVLSTFRVWGRKGWADGRSIKDLRGPGGFGFLA